MRGMLSGYGDDRPTTIMHLGALLRYNSMRRGEGVGEGQERCRH